MRPQVFGLLFITVAAIAAQPAQRTVAGGSIVSAPSNGSAKGFTSLKGLAEKLRGGATLSASGEFTDEKLQAMAIELYTFLEGPQDGFPLQTTMPRVKGVFIDYYVPPSDQQIVYVRRAVAGTVPEYGFSFEKKTGILKSITIAPDPKPK